MDDGRPLTLMYHHTYRNVVGLLSIYYIPVLCQRYSSILIDFLQIAVTILSSLCWCCSYYRKQPRNIESHFLLNLDGPTKGHLKQWQLETNSKLFTTWHSGACEAFSFRHCLTDSADRIFHLERDTNIFTARSTHIFQQMGIDSPYFFQRTTLI